MTTTQENGAGTLLCVPGDRVVPNSLDRFLLTGHSPLVRETDGSLRIFVGPRLPVM